MYNCRGGERESVAWNEKGQRQWRKRTLSTGQTEAVAGGKVAHPTSAFCLPGEGVLPHSLGGHSRVLRSVLLCVRVLGQNGSGQNGRGKMVWTKWFADKMVCGQNGIGLKSLNGTEKGYGQNDIKCY